MPPESVQDRRCDVQQQVRWHYDAYPFDNFTDEVLGRLQNHSLLGRALSQHSHVEAMQVEVGCGTGKSVALLERCGRGELIGVDLSISSLRKVRARFPTARVINAPALALPLSDGVASLVVSEGVIMVTPDAHAAFRECARILSLGGHLFISVYNANHRYRRVYGGVGGVMRRLGSGLGGRFVLHRMIVPLWYVYFCYARSLMTRGRISQLTLARSMNLFYDRYMAPHVTFHTVQELTSWATGCGLEVAASAERDAMLEVLLRRPAA